MFKAFTFQMQPPSTYAFLTPTNQIPGGSQTGESLPQVPPMRPRNVYPFSIVIDQKLLLGSVREHNDAFLRPELSKGLDVVGGGYGEAQGLCRDEGPDPSAQVQSLEGADDRLPVTVRLAGEEHGYRLGCAGSGEKGQASIDPEKLKVA